MKEVITAMQVNEARKSGRLSVAVPAGALVTPQARDDAAHYGIKLVPAADAVVAPARHAPSVPPYSAGAALPGGVQAALSHVKAAVENVAARMAGLTGPPELPNQPGPPNTSDPLGPVKSPARPPAPANTGLAGVIREQVLKALASSGESAACPGLESVIAEVLAEYTANLASQAPVSGRYAGKSIAAQGNTTERQTGVTFSQASALPGVPGVMAVRPGGGSGPESASGVVEVEECLLPDQSGPGVTRLAWAESSFAWTFEYDEVLVVTSGRVEVNHESSPSAGLVLEAGDAMRVSAGSSVTLKAVGRACCVCGSWPCPARGA